MGFLSKLEDPYNSVLAPRQPRPVHPAAEGALKFASALNALNSAEQALDKAKANVPSYTGQWSSEDYYAEEQEAYNRAAETFAFELAQNAFRSAQVGLALSKHRQPDSQHQTYMSRKIAEALPSLSAKEKEYCEGLVYIGDLVAKIDSSQCGKDKVAFSTKTLEVLRAIPPRLGMEDWVRPEESK